MKKIMFNDKYGLTTAVLEGRKTMTRRVITSRLQSIYLSDEEIPWKIREASTIKDLSSYKIGEDVALAQPYKNIIAAITPTYGSPHAYDHLRSESGWNNKMFVRTDLMPHRIRITGIKVERMQDISEEDAMREGIFHYEKPPLYHECDRFAPWPPYVKPYKHDHDNLKYRATARYAFAYLIDKVSGIGTWKKNPWVFVYEFELLR